MASHRLNKIFTEKTVLVFAAVILGIVTSTKFILAARFPLFIDEAFYWLCAQHPAPAYIDHPFMTAFFVKVGTIIVGNTYFGVRFIFLMIGLLMPFLIVLLARPLVNSRDAWLAGAVSLAVPHFAIMGILATPDVPLTFFALLTFIFFERATRKGDMVSWFLVGISFALGFSTHYRFIVVIAGLIIYLILTENGRKHIKRKGLWLSFIIGSVGILPLILFNLSNDFQSMKFQFLDRHPWTFQPIALLQPLKQALMITPFLYISLILVLIASIKKARQGDDRHALIACFALVHLAGYFLIGFWADQENASVYWTWSGYIPLVIFLPDLLRRLHKRIQDRDGGIMINLVPYAIPITGLTGSALVFIYICLVSSPDILHPSASNNSLFYKEAIAKLLPSDSIGWREAASRVKMIRPKLSMNNAPVLVAHNCEMAPELAFELNRTDPIYVLDHPLNIKHGRTFQYHIWGTDERSLKLQPGLDAIIVIEDTVRPGPDHRQWAKRLCKMFETVKLIDELSLLDGWRHFLYFQGKNLRPVENYPEDSECIGSCDFPPFGSLDTPKSGAVVSGSIVVNGWASHDTKGIESVEILLNGDKIGNAHYGRRRPDIKRAFPDATDPNLPNVGFEFFWDISGLKQGKYLLSIRASTKDGKNRIIDRKKIKILSEK
jgi:hypothetical protein